MSPAPPEPPPRPVSVHSPRSASNPRIPLAPSLRLPSIEPTPKLICLPEKRRGIVDLSAPLESLSAGLASHRVARVINRRKSGLRSCYEERLRIDPHLEGQVKVQFTIETSGRVSKAEQVSASLADPLVGRCIASSLKRWRFPKPDEPATFRLPIHFRAALECQP